MMQVVINIKEKTIILFQPVTYTSLMKFLESIDATEYADFTIHTARLEDLQQLNTTMIKPIAEA